MQREDDIIDLGTASIETKGFAGPGVDERLGQILPGLSAD